MGIEMPDAARTRARYQDRTVALTQDDLHFADGAPRDGRGALWRQWLPRTYLRCAFHDLRLSQSAAASRYGSHTTVGMARKAVAEKAMEAQRLRMEELFPMVVPFDKLHSWVTYQLQWDEAKFSVISDQRVAGMESVLTAHGVLTWEASDLSAVRCEEVVLPPAWLILERRPLWLLHWRKPTLWWRYPCSRFCPRLSLPAGLRRRMPRARTGQ